VNLTRRLPALLLPALLALAAPGAPAHAAPLGLDAGFVLQGSVAYNCYGCGPGATFNGVATFAGERTVPATGALTVTESCGPAGGGYGTLRVGTDDYPVWLTRAGSAVVVSANGPGGAWQPYAGPGTLLLDAPPGTCGIPVTATLNAAMAPFVYCACLVAGGDG
jgi:hypothetical protein